MIIINLGYHFLTNAPKFGAELNPHLGILFISGLFFGPYGCVGATIGNLICDLVRGYGIAGSILSAFISFLIAFLAYKLWYARDFSKHIITRPRFNNSYNLIYLMIIIAECGLLYSMLTANIGEIFNLHVGFDLSNFIYLRYYINFVNFSLLFSFMGILICRVYDFTYTPETSQKTYGKEYEIIHFMIIIMMIAYFMIDIIIPTLETSIIEIIALSGFIILYIRKPIKHVDKVNYYSIPEKIINNFILLTLILLIFNMIIIITPLQEIIFEFLVTISLDEQFFIILLLLDISIILFFIPTLIFVTYIEGKVINPIKSFSRIESFIKKDERIQTDKILDIYSDYIEQEDEIGILSRSYTHLIQNNNEYIDNLRTLEAEKLKIEAELNIAHNIQQAILPIKSIDNEYITVNGFCKPAKEVGGDFYDYYEVDDDNTVIIIGDASGKGVPAALFTTLIQNSIKLLIKNELDPAKILSQVNNQRCEENPEIMFITLFLGIYNNKTHKLTYANAGHNPPIIKKETKYEFLEVDSEIVMGIMAEYEYTNHEILINDELILYTDGITDSQNSQKQLYGEDKLIDCLNNLTDKNIINGLINDIKKYCEDEEQFDDMTLLTLKVKK